jgi:hypothetical protein
VQVTATLRCILDKSADHMPYRFRTLASGGKIVNKVLPCDVEMERIYSGA